MNVPEWANGTALYYWSVNPLMGANELLQPVLLFLFSQPLIITLTTWGVILLEIALFVARFVSQNKWSGFIIPLFHRYCSWFG